VITGAAVSVAPQMLTISVAVTGGLMDYMKYISDFIIF
jgi:hypothetical protein